MNTVLRAKACNCRIYISSTIQQSYWHCLAGGCGHDGPDDGAVRTRRHPGRPAAEGEDGAGAEDWLQPSLNSGGSLGALRIQFKKIFYSVLKFNYAVLTSFQRFRGYPYTLYLHAWNIKVRFNSISTLHHYNFILLGVGHDPPCQQLAQRRRGVPQVGHRAPQHRAVPGTFHMT